MSHLETDIMKLDIETSFSIKLKKPDLYLITCTQKNIFLPGITHSSAVWNAGKQPYLYMGILNTYYKMKDNKCALAASTGISSGAAFTIPSLFLQVFKDQPRLFSRLITPELEKIEKVGDEECYVISGSSTGAKKETSWISKKRYLIIMYSQSLEPPEGV